MTYMIIETFKAGKVEEIYRRLDARGRMQPDGLVYINSWIADDLRTCYQVMETDSEAKLHEWMSHWDDVMEFKIVRVLSSAEARQQALASRA